MRYHYKMIGVLALAIGAILFTGIGQCVGDANVGTAQERAVKAFEQQDYKTALPLFKQALAESPNAPDAPDADETIKNIINCEMALERWQDALVDANKLQRDYPDSPYLATAIVDQYQIDVHLHAAEAADKCWNDIMTRWPNSKYANDAYVAYLSLADLSALPKNDTKLAQILKGDWTKESLMQNIYQPLIRNGHIDNARLVHEKFQQFFTQGNNPALVTDDEDAYLNSFTMESVAAMFSYFKVALAKNDEPAAKKWLTMLNLVAAEDQNAVEARKLYRQHVATAK